MNIHELRIFLQFVGRAEDPGNGYKGDAIKQLINPFVH